jgi:hypothetical protein
MKFLGAAASHLMARGVLSAGWYSILTGLALLYLAYVLGRIPWDIDRAALLVSVALGATGVWQLTRGLQAEFQRKPKPTAEPS